MVANGLNVGLREKLGMQRRDISRCHSIMLGFDLAPQERAFPFPALTYYGEHIGDRTAYITLFPIGHTMRANLCVYRDMHDPWLRAFREAPRDTLMALMPGLARITGPFEVAGPVKIRPADLYVTTGVRQAGIVLVGDAFATSCPAAGTGTGKVFTDVERCATCMSRAGSPAPRIGAHEIAAFYDDPVKTAYDEHSAEKAFDLRALTIDPSFTWEAQRRLRYVARLCIGRLREWRAGLLPQPGLGRARAALRSMLGLFGA